MRSVMAVAVVVGAICGILLFAHSGALAQQSSAELLSSDPAVLPSTVSADYGILFDSAGIVFTSDRALIVPPVPGTPVTEGPAAGSRPQSSLQDRLMPALREAVP